MLQQHLDQLAAEPVLFNRLVPGTLRVLALDPDRAALNRLLRTLLGLGFESVTSCDNANAALSEIDQARVPPDLILLDPGLPIDGLEFVRQLVERRYRGSVVLLGGDGRRVRQIAQTMVRAHRIDVLGHLDKPVAPATLLDLIRHAHCADTGGAGPVEWGGFDPGTLGRAIERGELVNHYQPQIELDSGALAGIEVLVRWRQPDGGLVYPARFIPLAEQHGMIGALTRRVLREAFDQAGEWRRDGLCPRISVNVAMACLSHDFARFVVEQAASAGIPPGQVVLELTESQLIHDMRIPLEVLGRLRGHGFGLSLDDFGTGHASLVQLRDIVFDELKIDRGFVHRAAANPTQRAIYDASLSLARQLGMRVVAEGVEDNDDWSLVCSTGCDMAQGFYMARPMPAAAVPHWAQGWRKPAC